MLPKTERLKDRRLFNIAFKRKQAIRTPLVSLYYLYEKVEKDINQLNGKYLPKTAFIVSTSIEKKANKRNLIKRRMREIYKDIKMPFYFIDKSQNKIYVIHVLIWISNPKVKDVTFLEVKKTMKSVLNKLELDWTKNIGKFKK